MTMTVDGDYVAEEGAKDTQEKIRGNGEEEISTALRGVEIRQYTFTYQVVRTEERLWGEKRASDGWDMNEVQ